MSSTDGGYLVAGLAPGAYNILVELAGFRSLDRRNVHVATGEAMEGYEIHIGRSEGEARSRPFARVRGEPEGAISRDGRIMGSYLHGMFASDTFRSAFLRYLGAETSTLAYTDAIETTLDALAAHIEAHVDVAGLLALAR